MTMRTIFFVVYPGFELLDLSGPLSVFATCNAMLDAPRYDLKTLSATPGLVASGAGLSVHTDALEEADIDHRSTLLVVGANRTPLMTAVQNRPLVSWLAKHFTHAERYGSICSGTFLLQAAGALDGKTVTTHWAGCEQLSAGAAGVTVLNEALYYTDGRCWTSAGVTTGIDMALEMLKRDQGKAVMDRVAKYLVVYSQRPGKQSQFAQIQNMKQNEEDAFSELIVWLRAHIDRPIKIAEMADHMCMSERSFQRKFSRSFGVSPSRFFERMRMEHARDFLLPKQGVELTAQALGYRSVAAFRSSFAKHFGLTPSTSKQLR